MSVLSRVRRRDVIWFVVLVVVVGALWVSDDRAEAGAPPPDGIDLVFVAVATNFPDALGVGPAAAAFNAPIILVPTSPPLPAETEAELLRLNPKEVVIVGGEAVVSQAMFDAISDLLPAATVDRLAGSNRYATNVAVSEAVYPLEGWAVIMAPAFATPSNSDPGVLEGQVAYNESVGVLHASIQLPHDSEILEVRADIIDLSGSEEVTFELRRHVSGGGVGETVATGTSGTSYNLGNTTAIATSISPGMERVDNEQYAYYVKVTGATDIGLSIRNLRVRYRLGFSG